MDEAPIFRLIIRDGSLELAGAERHHHKACRLREELIGGDEGAHGRVVRKHAAIDHSKTLVRSVLD